MERKKGTETKTVEEIKVEAESKTTIGVKPVESTITTKIEEPIKSTTNIKPPESKSIKEHIVKEESKIKSNDKKHHNNLHKEVKKLHKEEIEHGSKTVVKIVRRREAVITVDCEVQTIDPIDSPFAEYIKLKKELELTNNLKAYIKVIQTIQIN